MKTITEFSGFTLKEAVTKKATLLAEGKTEEEAQAAINEFLKLTEESKVTFYKNALDMTSSRMDQVKRVVVAVKSTETEKVPEAFSEREGNFYLVEFFPQASAAGRGRGDDRGYGRDDRGGRGGRGGGDRGRGGGRDSGRGGGDRGRGNDRGDRAPRGDSPVMAVGSGGPSPFVTNPVDPNFKLRGERKPRPPRGPRPEGAAGAPRGPRPPRAENQGPKGAAELRLVLKGQNQSTLQGSGTAANSPAPTTEAQVQPTPLMTNE